MQAIAHRVPLASGAPGAGAQNGADAGSFGAMTQEPRPVAGCILFLRPRAPAAAQASEANPAQALRAVAEAAAARWEAPRRIVLQSPEGLAIVGPVSPSAALACARRAAAHPQAAAVAIALHHGLLRVLGDPAGLARVTGDGITTAAVMAGLGGGRMLLSTAFRDALADEAPRRAAELEAVKDIAGPGGAALFRDHPERARSRAQRRSLLAAGGIVALLAAGGAIREARQRYAEAHRPALVLLEIRPAGEVFVDGVSQGMAPPLTRLSLPPGPHTIEVRSGRAKPLRAELELQPGEERRLKHVFVQPAPPRRSVAPAKPRPTPAPGPLDRFKFW